MQHHHTKACRKHGGNCRFRYPKFPMWKTVLSREVSEEDPDKKKAKDEKIKKQVKLSCAKLSEV